MRMFQYGRLSMVLLNIVGLGDYLGGVTYDAIGPAGFVGSFAIYSRWGPHPGFK